VSDAPALSVVIVAYRCRDLLYRCLSSLEASPPPLPLEVCVVDNGSADGTLEMLARDFPEVRVHAAGRNLGFGRATNVGIRGTTGRLVLALNPDVYVTPGALEAMLELMDAHPEVGIAGCRLELEDGSADHAAKRAFPTPVSALGHFTGLWRLSSGTPLAGYRAPGVERGRVDAVNGAFMLMRRQALDEVGLFDEGYWMYMEDLDLCYRFAEAGWTTWYEPSVTVLHVKHGTTGDRRSPRLERAFHYGMYRFYRKHYAPRRSAIVSGTVYAGIAARLAWRVGRSTLAKARGAR
jgi:GT2 family glycosyltransferase